VILPQGSNVSVTVVGTESVSIEYFVPRPYAITPPRSVMVLSPSNVTVRGDAGSSESSARRRFGASSVTLALDG
jgi:hypothetical protein